MLCVLLVHLCTTSIADENIDARTAETERLEIDNTAPDNVQEHALRKGRSDPLTFGVIGSLLLNHAFSKEDCEEWCGGPYAMCQFKMFKGYQCIQQDNLVQYDLQ